MKTLRNIFFFIIILLLLEVCQRVISGYRGSPSYFIVLLVGCFQFFIAIVFFLRIVSNALFSNTLFFKQKRILGWGLIILFFILGESTTVLFLNNPSYIPKSLYSSYADYYDFFDSRLIQYEKNQMVYDSSLFYRFKANNNFNFSNREFNNNYSINSFGLRDDEKSLKSPVIICLGDSYSMGWGVEQGKSYAQQIEKKAGLVVLNAGISSYGTARELKLLQLLDTSGVKFIIIQYCLNDYTENKMSVENHFNLNTSSKNSFDSVQQSYRRGRYYFPGKHFLSIGQLFLKKCVNNYWPIFKVRTIRETSVEDVRVHASVFIDNLYHSGISFNKVHVIVIFLDSYAHLQNPFLAEAGQLSNTAPYKSKFDNRLHFIEMGDVLNKDDYYLLDLHLKESGHKKIADKIWDEIRKY